MQVTAFTAITQRTNALREAAEAEQDFQRKLDQATARLQAPREEREETRLRLEAEQAGVTLTPQQEEQLQGLTRLRREQERLVQVLGIWRDVSQSVESAWTSALSSIADHTRTVSEAFREMAKSILQSFAKIS